MAERGGKLCSARPASECERAMRGSHIIVARTTILPAEHLPAPVGGSLASFMTEKMDCCLGVLSPSGAAALNRPLRSAIERSRTAFVTANKTVTI